MTDRDKIIANQSEEFKNGVRFADQNPSPKVLAYIKCAETMIKLQQCPMDDPSTWHQIMIEGSKAVGAVEAEKND